MLFKKNISIHKILLAKKHMHWTIRSYSGTSALARTAQAFHFNNLGCRPFWQQKAWVTIPFTSHHIKRLNHYFECALLYFGDILDTQHIFAIIPWVQDRAHTYTSFRIQWIAFPTQSGCTENIVSPCHSWLACSCNFKVVSSGFALEWG